MKNKKVIISFLIIVVVIIGIAIMWKPLRFDRFGMSMIDWVDMIQYNDVSYKAESPREEINPQDIGDNIGKVDFMLSGNVGNPKYKVRNYDATYLPKNTKLFAIKNEPGSIAALVDGKYYKFNKVK